MARKKKKDPMQVLEQALEEIARQHLEAGPDDRRARERFGQTIGRLALHVWGEIVDGKR